MYCYTIAILLSSTFCSIKICVWPYFASSFFNGFPAFFLSFFHLLLYCIRLSYLSVPVTLKSIQRLLLRLERSKFRYIYLAPHGTFNLAYTNNILFIDKSILTFIRFAMSIK